MVHANFVVLVLHESNDAKMLKWFLNSTIKVLKPQKIVKI